MDVYPLPPSGYFNLGQPPTRPAFLLVDVARARVHCRPPSPDVDRDASFLHLHFPRPALRPPRLFSPIEAAGTWRSRFHKGDRNCYREITSAKRKEAKGGDALCRVLQYEIRQRGVACFWRSRMPAGGSRQTYIHHLLAHST